MSADMIIGRASEEIKEGDIVEAFHTTNGSFIRKARPEEPIIVLGLTLSAIAELRNEYQKRGGPLPITEQSVREIFKPVEYSRRYCLSCGRNFTKQPGEPFFPR